ncbi:NADH dehydrogenase (ubiquinone), putative [Acanthamoeba castellanii str. Neff]|uniref:NADH:ubiquinone reductase (non-electrogenic) n=1 Tax=Acanthamoeba castellanii (strain ATCC 30010 / Neff) TaxID=1257118 RepID=L8GQM0_ACACF|nr:NADH dehydrogenase (ubiquinone), putative [Acanthamoeba castellanii str. Neff]ELR14431.1 NADH dehydrogenase (ubiquinone), putative [Acanthamoeba castellanii str. Neff]
MRSRVTTSTARTSTSTLLAVAYRPAAHTATALPLSGPRFVRALATTTTVDGGKQRKKLVVLGNGWAGYRLILDVDISKYELSVISPRNYFLFTPLLTSTTVSDVPKRARVERSPGVGQRSQCQGRSLGAGGRARDAGVYHQDHRAAGGDRAGGGEGDRNVWPGQRCGEGLRPGVQGVPGRSVSERRRSDWTIPRGCLTTLKPLQKKHIHHIQVRTHTRTPPQ